MALTIERKLIITTFLVLCMWTPQAMSRTLPEQSMSDRHEQWMAKYNRVYKDLAEKETRFQIFKENVEFIESFNRDTTRSYKLAVNHLADMTNDEFRASRNGNKFATYPKSYVSTQFKYENVSAIPSTMDWRKKGAVTAIKDQGQCGKLDYCYRSKQIFWLFGKLLGVFNYSGYGRITKISTGTLISLSEQELVDCDRSGEDEGCNGGYMEDGFGFIVKNKGIAAEKTYPYVAADGTCKTKDETPVAAKITGYEKVPVNSETALLNAVANQPVSVSIDAGDSSFQFYSSGVFTGECGTELDHGVTAVGYGASNGKKYWLVKNSWGTSWGEEGYIRMERDIDAKEGLCGIAMDASYPTA